MNSDLKTSFFNSEPNTKEPAKPINLLKYHIRPAVAADARGIRSLLDTLLNIWERYRYNDFRKLNPLLGPKVSLDNAHVAVIGEDIVGVIFFYASGKGATCKYIIVDPDYCGQGIGTALYKYMITCLRNAKMPFVKMVYPEQDYLAGNFLKKMGANVSKITYSLADSPKSIDVENAPIAQYEEGHTNGEYPESNSHAIFSIGPQLTTVTARMEANITKLPDAILWKSFNITSPDQLYSLLHSARQFSVNASREHIFIDCGLKQNKLYDYRGIPGINVVCYTLAHII